MKQKLSKNEPLGSDNARTHPLNKGLIRSFGRIKSRKLSDRKKDLHTDLLPKYEILLEEIDDFIKLGKATNPDFETHLEIGFGFGDSLFENAKRNPHINYIGSETHINGIIYLLDKLEKEPLPNLRIFQSDVRLLLEKIPDNFFKKIYILFPDPWPKAKHHKRRLINEWFLKLLNQKLAKNSKLIIATDHDSYKEWIFEHLAKSNLFSFVGNSSDRNLSAENFNVKNSNANWNIFPKDWVVTKYQKKAKIEGRISIYLELNKCN